MTAPRRLIRYEEATLFIASIPDERLKAALTYALTTVIAGRGMDPALASEGDFDLRFYLEAMKAVFENEVVLRAIMDGKQDSLRWW